MPGNPEISGIEFWFIIAATVGLPFVAWWLTLRELRRGDAEKSEDHTP